MRWIIAIGVLLGCGPATAADFAIPEIRTRVGLILQGNEPLEGYEAKFDEFFQKYIFPKFKKLPEPGEPSFPKMRHDLKRLLREAGTGGPSTN